MNEKREKNLLVLSLVLVIGSLNLLFIIGPENLGNPEEVEYILKLVLYPTALLAIVLLSRALGRRSKKPG